MGETSFGLVGIVEHEGAGIGFGHYVALGFCKPGVWVKYNDSRVRVLSTDDVIYPNPNAYLLFYAQLPRNEPLV